MPNGRSSFVVVANRLPVDRIEMPDGSTAWRREPRRARDRAGTGDAASSTVPGSAGPAAPTRSAGSLRHDGMHLVPVPLTAEDVERYYEGFSNATLWPLYHDVIVPPEFHRDVVGGLRRGQPAVRARRPREVAADGRRRVGARLPAAAGPGDAARSCGPTCGSGSSCTSRSRRPSCSRSCRGGGRSCDGLLGADLVGFQRPGAAVELRRAWPATGCGLRDPTATGSRRCPTTGSSAPRRSRSPSTSASWTSLARQPETEAPRREIRARARRPRARSCSASTGSTTPRASGSGCKRVRRAAATDGALDRVDDAVFVQVATPEPRAGRAVPADARRGRAAGRPDQRRARPDRPRRRALPAPRPYSRTELVALYLRRRRHAGHAAARRHEPGRQGVRRLPGTTRPARWC